MARALQTDRLILRAFRDTDFEAYAAMCADAEVMRFLGDGKPLSRRDAWRHLALMIGHWQLRGYGCWAVEERRSGEMIGRIGFWNPEGWPGFEVGWALRREFWGRGYATEGARAALAHAFVELGEERVISVIHPDNAASVRVALRLGEKPAGTVEFPGHPAPLSVYALHRADFRPSLAGSGL